MVIRRETVGDYDSIDCVVERAFASAEHADGNERELVRALRRDPAYLSQLGLVAERDGQIVGHVLFTEARVGNAAVLALAPLAVLPEAQRQGVGTALVRKGHRLARELGYGYSVVLGSETYYPRLDYQPADLFGIRAPFVVPRENFMACRLRAEAPMLDGTLRYAEAFGIA